MLPPEVRQTFEQLLPIYGQQKLDPLKLEYQLNPKSPTGDRADSGAPGAEGLILRELAAHKKPFLVFDWKRNYRDLLQRPEFRRLRVYTVGRKVARSGSIR